MAVILLGASDVQSVEGSPTISRWGRGDFLRGDLKSEVSSGTGGVKQYIYRGEILGSYVYSTGSPPIGADNVVIVGRTTG
jgi:hypothetical protein